MSRAPTDPGNGSVTGPMPDIDTGRIRKTISSESGHTVHELAEALSELMGSNGGDSGGGVPPETHLKTLKKHNWITAVLVLLFGSGGVMGSYYATKSRAEANETRSIKNDSRIEANIENVRLIRVDVSGLAVAQEKTTEALEDVSKGLGELKEESLDKLKEEKRVLERELWRERRRSR